MMPSCTTIRRTWPMLWSRRSISPTLRLAKYDIGSASNWPVKKSRLSRSKRTATRARNSALGPDHHDRPDDDEEQGRDRRSQVRVPRRLERGDDPPDDDREEDLKPRCHEGQHERHEEQAPVRHEQGSDPPERRRVDRCSSQRLGRSEQRGVATPCVLDLLPSHPAQAEGGVTDDGTLLADLVQDDPVVLVPVDDGRKGDRVDSSRDTFTGCASKPIADAALHRPRNVVPSVPVPAASRRKVTETEWP